MSAVVDEACPRCGAPLARGQEYCLACGARKSGYGRFGPIPVERRPIARPLLVLAAAAVAGGALAYFLTSDPAAPTEVVIGTGGSVTVTTPEEQPRKALATWPAGEEGWTIVVVSVPKVQGRQAAVDVASAARARGLVGVGVLDSSRYASLHPGYWLVFSDRYASEAEATGALLRARTFSKSARVQRVAG